jgi:molybdenum cofactor cytidylyltransferase
MAVRLTDAARKTRVTHGGRISAILLAAGISSRFGRPKQLAELEGAALVRRAVSTLERSPVDEIVVVIGHGAPEVARALEDARVTMVVNRDYRTGLASSIKAGLAALSPESGAVLVCLADQPLVTPRLVRKVVSRYRRTGADVVACTSQGLISPPVLFSARLYRELAKLQGDAGAKVIIERHPGYEKVSAKPGELLDVDTEDDLVRAGDALKHGPLRGATRSREGDGS